MINLKQLYQERNIDYFTEEYYEYVSKLKDYKNNFRRKEAYYTTDNFREKGNALFECLGIEIVHQLHCQLKCEYCYVALETKGDSIKPVPVNEILNVIDQAAEVDVTTGKTLFGQIGFIGGEPSLHPHLPKLLEYTLEQGLIPILITNAVKLAKIEYARKVCLPGMVIVTHLPYLDKEGDIEHDRITRFPGYTKTLETAIKNILMIKKELKTIGKDFEFVGDYVINTQTLPYAFDVHKFCRKNGISPFFERMRISDDQRNQYLAPERKDLKDLLYKIYEYDKVHYPDLIFNSNDISYEEELLKKIEYLITPAFANACSMTQTGIHVKYNQNGFGEAMSCVGQTISHGNLKSNSLREIVNNKVKSRIFSEQETFISGPCSVCELYHSIGCEGGCRGNANNAFNCARASDPDCLFIKKEYSNDKTIMAPKNCDDCPVGDWASCSSIYAQKV